MYVRFHLYSDEFELCNPLGSRKGEYKLCAFYFLVGNLETKYWSLLSNIRLDLLCKYKHVKSFGYKVEMDRSSANAEVRPKNSAECSARQHVTIRPNFNKKFGITFEAFCARRSL